MLEPVARQVPVVLCIDVEPDGLQAPDPHDPKPWQGFEQTAEFIEGLRPALSDATGDTANVNWFLRMDPQIETVYGSPSWVVDTYARQLTTLRSHGDVVGLHTHASRWREGSSDWLIDHGDQAWIDHCVHMAFATFEAEFNTPCRHHRFGDHFLTNDTLALVERLGARIDLTTEPGEPAIDSGKAGMAFTGSLPDLTMVPRVPYRPAPDDFRRRGARGDVRSIWMLPLSCTDEGDPSEASPASPPLWRRWTRTSRARRWLPRPTHRLLATWKYWPTPDDFWNAALKSCEDLPQPYLALAVRSDELIRPVEGAARFGDMLRHVVGTPRLAERLRFTTADEALVPYRRRALARS
jgi:hypothetical protein